MVPICPDAPRSSQQPVDQLREADTESLHAAVKLSSATGLDQKVNVIGLHRELGDSEVDSGREREGTAYDRKYWAAPQRPEAGQAAHRYVNGMSVIVERTTSVRDAGRGTRGLSSRTATTTPVSPEFEVELRTAPRHLE